MNVTLVFQHFMKKSTSPESLEITRLEALHLQISSDIETLQEKEKGLREYELRLRQLVDQTHQHPQTHQPSPSHSGSMPSIGAKMDAEWEKYQRAHALLEAARRGLCDDRLALKARESDLVRLDEQLSRREAWIKIREQELKVLGEIRAAVPPTSTVKSKTSFTQAPFMAVRNLLARES